MSTKAKVGVGALIVVVLGALALFGGLVIAVAIIGVVAMWPRSSEPPDGPVSGPPLPGLVPPDRPPVEPPRPPPPEPLHRQIDRKISPIIRNCTNRYSNRVQRARVRDLTISEPRLETVIASLYEEEDEP